ncbi:alpha/beta fold hydrolase [Nonomuraea rubra]|uniref:alpha/beta fold hydrolase n=1 Tax=Nonomuraea rubra TaxID=46180 RepID=UPI00360FD08C
MSGKLSVRGCDLRYADSGGDGVPVVFSHGAGADHVMFEAQWEHLRGLGCRVVAWDLRGHGLSRPAGVPFTAEQAMADLYALIGHLGLDRPVLVGQSLGGNLGQAVVRRQPGLARALIVIGATPNTAALSWRERLLVKAAAPMLSVMPAKDLPRLMAEASAVTPEARADARRAFGQVPKRSSSRCGGPPPASSPRSRLPHAGAAVPDPRRTGRHRQHRLRHAPVGRGRRRRGGRHPRRRSYRQPGRPAGRQRGDRGVPAYDPGMEASRAMSGREAFITSVGDLLAAWNLPHATGRVYGLLLLSEEPISLDTIAAELGLSKGL